MKSHRTLRKTAVAFILACNLAAHAQPSSTTSISFQAALTGADGQALSNGNYTLGFRFWDGPAPGGNAVSTNILISNVPVTGGVASTAIPADPVWFNGQTRYLGISVNGAAELTPRVLVTSVPYAAYSHTTRGITFDSDGRATIIRQDGSPIVPGAGNLWLVGDSNDGALLLGVNNNSAFIQSHASKPLLINPAGNRVEIGNATEGVDIVGNLDVRGGASTSYLQITGGADLAEKLDVLDPNPNDEYEVEPGMLVSIDSSGNRRFKLADEPYDKKRVGIISGGNGVKPGLVLRDEGNPHADGEHPIALTGQVWVHADASFGSIVSGDLLTTSATPGHAMKVSDDAKARFTVLGQALTGLKEGRGWVQVLVGKQ